MAFVLALLSLGLAYAGCKYRPLRSVLLGFALLNIAGAGLMMAEHHPYAYTLKKSTTAPGID